MSFVESAARMKTIVSKQKVNIPENVGIAQMRWTVVKDSRKETCRGSMYSLVS
jgi:hypothetical protein